jgi:hypothetical protein
MAASFPISGIPFALRFEGTGLGLPLAQRLAELHGSGLAITSAKGSGTVATLYLPTTRVLASGGEDATAAGQVMEKAESSFSSDAG